MTAIVASTAPSSSLPATAGGAPQGESGAFGDLLAALDGGTTADPADELAAATVTTADLANPAAQSDGFDAAQAAALAAAQAAAAANLVAAMSLPVAQASPQPVLDEDADKTSGSDVAAVNPDVFSPALPSLDLAGQDLLSPMGEGSPLAAATPAETALSALNVDLASVPAGTTPAPQASRAAETARPPAAPAQAAAPAPPALAALPEVVSVVGVIVAPTAPKAEAAPAPIPADAVAPAATAATAATAAQPVPTTPPVKTPDDKASNPKTESPLEQAHQSVTAVQAEGSADSDASAGGDDKAPGLKADATSVPEAVSEDAAVFAPAPPTAAAPLAATTVAAARVTPETVAHLSAEIARKTDSKSTRFDIVLTPEGLGRVDVRVEIAADGKLSAALSFDNPQAASDLRGKAGELRQALSLAGFDVADNALKFDLSSGQGGQSGQGGLYDFQNGENGRRAFQGRAFQAAAAEDLPPLTAADLPPGLRMAAASGLDVRI